MGNIQSNLTIITSSSTGVYILICQGRGYKLFINTINDMLIITATSLQNGKTYSLHITLSELLSFEIFSSYKTINEVKTAVEKGLKQKALRLEEKENTIKLIFVQMKKDKPITCTFDLTEYNNDIKDDCTFRSSKPLLESLILDNNIELYSSVNEFINDECSLQTIVMLYNNGKYDEALKIIGEKPVDVHSLYFKALCLYKLGNYIDALSNFITLNNRIKDADIELYIEKCRKLLKGKENDLYSEAAKIVTDKVKMLELLNKAVEINPKFESGFSLKARILIDLLRYDEATECIDKALEINPNYYAAYNNRALVYSAEGKYSEALECLDKALKINSKVSLLYLNKGIVLLNLNKFDEAIDNFNKTIEYTPLFDLAYSFKGEALICKKQYDEALHLFDKAIELYPNSFIAFAYKGKALICMKRFEEAIETLNKAIGVTSKNDIAYYYKGYALHCLNIESGGVELFNKSKEFNLKERVYYDQLTLNDFNKHEEIVYGLNYLTDI
jgi:tetratricopeptide (TPR) repeat protein